MKFENIYKETEESMRSTLLSFWAKGNITMQKALNEMFEREPLLAEPVFQCSFGWKKCKDESWKNSLHEDVIQKLEIGETYSPYEHQGKSWKALKNEKSIVVTSGTGSGKTECFMYPIISDLYEQRKNNEPKAIEAIFLYPLNALMYDQKDRLKKYCKKTGLHFAVYNGKTDEYKREEELIVDNEVMARNGIREAKTRPEILLTNPSMLEYILVREADRRMLKESQGKLRWIVIDEAHTYSGSAAVELAYQIKRILNAFGVTPNKVRFACTSATIGGENGSDELKRFIANITGQDIDKIEIIGGEREIPELDEEKLEQNLKERGLPKAEKVITLRNEITKRNGMRLQEIWNILYETPFNILDTLKLIDTLCDLKIYDKDVLSLRGHFFMRAINGLYACANPYCEEANSTPDKLYGRLTTYKSSTCTCCKAPVLELVQCKKCGDFILTGYIDPKTKEIKACEENIREEDYFSTSYIDEDSDDEIGTDNLVFLLPNGEKTRLNPLTDSTQQLYSNIEYKNNKHTLIDVLDHERAKWIELKNARNNKPYCPNCGNDAFYKGKINFKHFKIPIRFVNQTIAPVLLKEAAENDDEWGKYIAFTDSRQGTAISAKTFNITVESYQSKSKIMQELINNLNQNIEIPQPIQNLIDSGNLTQEQQEEILRPYRPQPNRCQLYTIASAIYNDRIFRHISENRTDSEQSAYKNAISRHYIGRNNLYDISAERMGLIKLIYTKIDQIPISSNITNYNQTYGTNIKDQDWRDFLKIYLDYFFRAGNHIQCIEPKEKEYIRSGDIGMPCKKRVEINENGRLNRIIVLLCAGLGITSREILDERRDIVNYILNDAWQALIEQNILTKIQDNGQGYANVNKDYIGQYFLDLSIKENNNTCRIELCKRVWICPITHNFVDTTFCGYSPYIKGDISEDLFKKYKCERTINMPQYVDNAWSKDEIATLKNDGYWNSFYEFAYSNSTAYIAAEHSAQQSDRRLNDYTEKFRNGEINVLHCSTTMEMGVDIGDIKIVLMDTVPPTAANYMQRAGRAGRKGQTKSVAFSLCDNTPVGQQAFANPMWALETKNHMIEVLESNTIIQRHINSFFFREFFENGTTVKRNLKDFVENDYDSFVIFLQSKENDEKMKVKFKELFGNNMKYSIKKTQELIKEIIKAYAEEIKALKNAYEDASNENDNDRQIAIAYQIIKLENMILLRYLSNHQFFPNANMPTGLVTFDFITNDDRARWNEKKNDLEQKKNRLQEAEDYRRSTLEKEINDLQKSLDNIYKNNTITREVYLALNEYAPGQTVVINERNYVSAGLVFKGAYNEESQKRGIYHCENCGNIEYLSNLNINNRCPKCDNPYHGIIDSNNSHYTLAYEPVGFKTDGSKFNRIEKEDKQYYEINPILLNTDWSNDMKKIGLCEIVSSKENDKILFYNVGIGFGFAFCKKCGRATIEKASAGDIPNFVKPGHYTLWNEQTCNATEHDIARNVVFTGELPTCYTVFRFKENVGEQIYIGGSEQKALAFSIGVIIKRFLPKVIGIDENEINFDIKFENNAWLVFVYDTAKGGCGYSLRLKDEKILKKVFEKAKEELEKSTCNCHEDVGACTKCLIDRYNYKRANLLSKGKVLNWLESQLKTVN